jgi:hypothetical protein
VKILAPDEKLLLRLGGIGKRAMARSILVPDGVASRGGDLCSME